MFTPLIRAIGQLGDPSLIRVVVASVVLSALCFIGLAAGALWVVQYELAGGGRWSWLAGAVSALVAGASAIWLFLPLAVVIAGLFLEPVCRAVERRWYPDLPPPAGATILSQVWDGVNLAALILVFSVVSLIVSVLLPGPGHLLGIAISAWALGRGMFAGVAFRRMERGAAMRQYRAQGGAIFLQGLALSLAGSVPIVNLLLPVLGPAAMVHLVEAGRRGGRAGGRESWG